MPYLYTSDDDFAFHAHACFLRRLAERCRVRRGRRAVQGGWDRGGRVARKRRNNSLPGRIMHVLGGPR